nr:SDR family NAD(P)-dependent oxidoreductase [Rhodococcus qingshengii]
MLIASIVTGASSSLGLGFARAIGSVGAAVVVAPRRGPRLDELCAELASDGIIARPFVIDVPDNQQPSRLSIPPSSGTQDVAGVVAKWSGDRGERVSARDAATCAS